MPGSCQGEPKKSPFLKKADHLLIIYKYRERSIHGPFSSILTIASKGELLEDKWIISYSPRSCTRAPAGQIGWL